MVGFLISYFSGVCTVIELKRNIETKYQFTIIFGDVLGLGVGLARFSKLGNSYFLVTPEALIWVRYEEAYPHSCSGLPSPRLAVTAAVTHN